ncbi:interleukin-6 receptor subunit alpha isoform X2 [Manacus candei]|uniref:interleukin-6 receptor subunit alpha isoform X2 n=1 Tax=Manacus candei TaxID=415023 RepID=UPI00222639BD|nr:interleukin-6 receptor subunit alpha isoform X2 [Manacus candei]
MLRPPGPLLLPRLLLLLLLQFAAAGRPCGPSGLSRDVVLGRLGANITLICRDEVPANVTVQWQVEERGAAVPGGRGRRLAEGNVLLLRWLRYEDSGRYVCSVGSRLLRSLRLLVEEPLETPQVSCYRRSHDKDVLCEWPQRTKPSPGTRAMLWVKRRAFPLCCLGLHSIGCIPCSCPMPGLVRAAAPTELWPHRFTAENATEQRCRYFSKARKFVCRVKVPPGTEDTKHLVVSTCVSNSASGLAGKDKIITLSSVLKPDPPLNVTVEALEKAPQWLRVNWSYPLSWDPRFYWLRFQVRYRPEPAPAFMEVDQVTTTWLDIRDAWRGTKHVVQVRAQDEFGHGTWSEWSREAVGTPWTDPRDFTSEKGPFSSQFPLEDDSYEVTLPPELFWEDRADGADGSVMEPSAHPVASPYAFLVAGGSLLLGIALFVGIVVRYRQMWWTGRQRGTKPEGEGQHMLVPLGLPRPPLSDTPLLSCPTPTAPGTLHITHLDYSSSRQ